MTSSNRSSLNPSSPIYHNIPSSHLVISAGTAIFHLATARVVICYHTRDNFYFLPKGRRDANEDSTLQAAEREGFEESGYRNRILPLPVEHRQPRGDEGDNERSSDQGRFVKEAIWTQLLPLNRKVQYMLFWYAAETVPEKVEVAYTEAEIRERREDEEGKMRRAKYISPPSFPDGLTLRQRIEADLGIGVDGKEEVYEPVRHEGTGVDEEEACYKSYLLPIDEARRKLKGSIQEDVVRRAWEYIQIRMEMEQGRP